ncbi:MAG: bifunctional phosphopantothenoylcysteine decarboxylase/phosphopantothenate--cysteine ligase CoaBC [Thaumarchaeota archaeon]|nr:bifunctional phosphopantothenoylcysteine decarboxylase/phosphopantothenate--cysteine ligase CoaBC [Nitrososphaerota archaeon]
MNEHPSKDIVGSDGKELKGKRIVLCISASVAAYKAVDLARLLIRHGADVHVVMSKSSKILLTPDLMKWATGNEVVDELTWKLEHIQLANYGVSDLIMYYPCTGNTLSKIANGIDDTPVTSIASVALGSKIPIMIALAMHESMYENPVLKDNIEKLKGLVEFIEPNIIEGKAKVAESEVVLNAILAKFDSNSKLKRKNVLITAGATIEYIDPIRVITNPASGKLGTAIAEEANRLGVNVTMICGRGSTIMPNNVRMIKVNTSDEMMDTVIDELQNNNYDIAIMTAAVSDFKPERFNYEKIDTRSNEQIIIKLKTTSKIVDKIKKVSPQTFLIVFKADFNVENEQLVKTAYTKMKECNADMIVANDVGRKGSGMDSDNIEVFLISKDKRIIHIPLQSKKATAKKLLEEVLPYF